MMSPKQRDLSLTGCAQVKDQFTPQEPLHSSWNSFLEKSPLCLQNRFDHLAPAGRSPAVWEAPIASDEV